MPDPLDKLFGWTDKQLDSAGGQLQKAMETKAKFDSLFKKSGKPKSTPEPNLMTAYPAGPPALVGTGLSGVFAGIQSWMWIGIALLAFVLLFLVMKR